MNYLPFGAGLFLSLSLTLQDGVFSDIFLIFSGNNTEKEKPSVFRCLVPKWKSSSSRFKLVLFDIGLLVCCVKEDNTILVGKANIQTGNNTERDNVQQNFLPEAPEKTSYNWQVRKALINKDLPSKWTFHDSDRDYPKTIITNRGWDICWCFLPGVAHA